MPAICKMKPFLPMKLASALTPCYHDKCMRKTKKPQNRPAATFWGLSVLLVLAFLGACEEKQENAPPFFEVRAAYKANSPLVQAFFLEADGSDLAPRNGIYLANQTTNRFTRLSEWISNNQVDVAVVTSAEAILLLATNPDWRIAAEVGPAQRILLLVPEKEKDPPYGMVNFAGNMGRLALSYWQQQEGFDPSTLRKIRDAPESISLGHFRAEDARLVIIEPEDRKIKWRDRLQAKHALPQRLFILVQRTYAEKHPMLVQGFINAWSEVGAKIKRHDELLFSRTSNRTGLLPAELAQHFDQRLAVRPAKKWKNNERDESLTQLSDLIEAGKKAELVRSEFSLDAVF